MGYRREVIRTRHWLLDVALTGAGDRAYLLNVHVSPRWWSPYRTSVSVLDTETGRESGVVRVRWAFDGHLALHPSGTHLFAAAAGRLAIIDLARRRVARVRIGARPGAVLAAPGGTRVYVANTKEGTVSVIETRARRVVATVRTGRDPCALAMAGGRLFVANRGDGSVSAVDVERLVSTRILPVGGHPVALCSSPSGDRIYVATRWPSAIRVLRTDPFETIGTIPLSTRYPRPPILFDDPPGELDPRAVAVSRDGGHLVVGLFEPGTVQVVDLARERVVDEYDLGVDRFGGPSRIVADWRTGRFYVVCVGEDLTVLS